MGLLSIPASLVDGARDRASPIECVAIVFVVIIGGQRAHSKVDGSLQLAEDAALSLSLFLCQS